MKNLKTNMEPQVLKLCLPMNDYMTVNMDTSHQEVRTLGMLTSHAASAPTLSLFLPHL